MPTLSEILDNKAVVSAVSAVVGALFWNYVAWSRGRVRVLEYTVHHERVGVSAADTVFGHVEVTWQGNPVANLYLSTVTLENNTSSNLTGLTLKVWTGPQTFLLNESRELVGSPFLVPYTPEYAAAITVPAGEAPTATQSDRYWHGRDYSIPVLNRNQRVIFRYTTTAPESTNGPWIWMDLQHEGVRVAFRANLPQIHGVPVMYALQIGVPASVAVMALAISSGIPTWAAAAVCLFTGFVAQSLGAGLYRIGRFFYRVVFH